MPQGLSWEQEIQMARLALELRDASREELICRLLETQQELLLQRNEFREALEAEGIETTPCSSFCFDVTEEELLAVFGREPTEEEFTAYLNQRIQAHQEAARLDVDIEAIALGMEEA